MLITHVQWCICVCYVLCRRRYWWPDGATRLCPSTGSKEHSPSPASRPSYPGGSPASSPSATFPTWCPQTWRGRYGGGAETETRSSGMAFLVLHAVSATPPFSLQKVKEHLEQVFASRKSPNILRVIATVGAKPWVADLKDPQYVAGQKAIRDGQLPWKCVSICVCVETWLLCMCCKGQCTSGAGVGLLYVRAIQCRRIILHHIATSNSSIYVPHIIVYIVNISHSILETFQYMAFLLSCRCCVT